MPKSFAVIMTEPVATRSKRQIARSRGIGAIVGTLIGVGWLAYGVLWFSNLVRLLIVLCALSMILPLLINSRRLIAASRQLPLPNPAEQSAHRRVWLLFWLNFTAEIVLLNIAINLLARPSLQIYWIPAISFVVGLHFLPMAKFFRVSSYWTTGSVMMLVAVAMAAVMRSTAVSPFAAAAAEALINALILWLTAAHGLRTGARLVS